MHEGKESKWPMGGKGTSCHAYFMAKQKCEVGKGEAPAVGKKRKRKAEGGSDKGEKKKTVAMVGSDVDESEF